MYCKLFILAALLAVAVAHPPGHLSAVSPVVYSSPAYYQQPAYASVGTVVRSIPTAVSHQSISQVHSAQYVQPIVAPVVRTTYAAPAYTTYSAPAYTTYAAAAPVYKTYTHSAPVVQRYNVAAPIYNSYAPSYATAYNQWRK